MDRPKLMGTRQSDVDDEEDDEAAANGELAATSGQTVSHSVSQSGVKQIPLQQAKQAKAGSAMSCCSGNSQARHAKFTVQCSVSGSSLVFPFSGSAGIRDNSSHRAAQL
ncbi:uncharacterized protein UTRI_04104 [Ustilago trichophora]|uniref:Uncharacterized protein n=1 Tax=Ustilago trichophora TaxID=86804 RepID=A0A5C3E8W3_9BASI|nr:uncharacterized protein UTRI_04104 [Ustilago trichophora]